MGDCRISSTMCPMSGKDLLALFQRCFCRLKCLLYLLILSGERRRRNLLRNVCTAVASSWLAHRSTRSPTFQAAKLHLRRIGRTLSVLLVRIPIQGGHVFRFDGGQRSDMIPATIPI